MRSLALALSCSLAFAAAGDSRAADKPITIAIYAPNAPFESGTDRFAFVNRLAQQVSQAAGVQASGKAFARASDLEAAIRSHTVEFAVVDGVYLAERGVPYQVLAIATAGGDPAPRWALFSSTATRIEELQGKKLSMAASGPRDAEFASNALFDGELAVQKFFAERASAPDIAAAVAAVSLKKADAVFAPESQGKGLRKLFDVRDRIPNAAFCEVAAGLSAELVNKVKGAVIGHGAAGPALDGWRASGSEPYRTLAARMSAHPRRPVMVEPEVVRLEGDDVLVAPALEPGLPDLKALFWQANPQ